MLTDGLSGHRVSNAARYAALESFLGSRGGLAKAANAGALKKIGNAGRLLLIDEP